MGEAQLLPEADVKNRIVKSPSWKRKGDPCIMVIFGGAGDLSKRKLIPALCNLAEQGFLPQPFAIMAVTYSDLLTPRSANDWSSTRTMCAEILPTLTPTNN